MSLETKKLLVEIKKLNADEQLQLANSIYEQFETISYDSDLSKSQNKILHQRIEKVEAGNMKFKSWTEVKANLKNKK